MAFDRSSGSFATSPEIETNFGPIEFDDKNHSNTPSTGKLSLSAADRMRRNASAKLANPLAGISHAKLEEMGATYAFKHHIGDEEDVRAFRKGAILAQDPRRFSQVQGLTGMECDVLQREFSNRWSQPKLMYIVIILCSTCAAVQGMGQWHYLTLIAPQNFQLIRKQMRLSSTGGSYGTSINSASVVKIRVQLGLPVY